MSYRLKRCAHIVLLLMLVGCGANDDEINEAISNQSLGYMVQDGQLLKNGKPFAPKGVNALNTFGIDNSGLMATWNIGIVREFIGNLREQPIEGPAIQDSRGVFLHSLNNIVKQHRSEGRTVILCPFGWVDNSGERQLFTGLNPSEQDFFEAYKIKMAAIADYFKGQDDVWLQVWNEPYSFGNGNNYSHQLWYKDHVEMINNLRNVEGFDNIILIAGNEQGQGEQVLLEKGKDLLEHDSQIVFDLHAYGKWHENATQASITRRLTALQDAELPIIFGEVGVITEGAPLSNATNFLEACKVNRVGALAWLWNKNTMDQNALLTNDGLPNDTNNNDWGTTFKTFLLSD
ncbi:Glycoside hydrolase family protein [Croceitalea dokdonensis DOKDO 023]|uniref:Glycoside hydrolase family protein n=1 Tax=Croceitalea dokdonensis DOKDO 023 TaxID=1300341 RepID=A0A0P7AFW1_9FLAO|nr:cellulase family glycosylhydrolase [Croceitalea dokdonensis]KPM32251.1 Glycoside hydrolase family protein [Croceitalea dokdonensis DOKDO 023]